MNITFINNFFSKINPEDEPKFLPIHLLIADKVSYISMVANIMILYQQVDEHPDEFMLHLFESNFSNSEEAIAAVAEMRSHFPVYKKLLKLKHKDKQSLSFIRNFKLALNVLRNDLKESHLKMNRHYGLSEFFPYYDSKIFLPSIRYDKEISIKEDRIIAEIADAIINRDGIISITDHIETMFPFLIYNAEVIEDFKFIKIPLWKFPPVYNMPFEQHNYTRQQLLLALQPFNSALKELQNDFFSIGFTLENLSHFITSLNEKINPLIMPVQNEIDESLYLSSIKNNHPENSGLLFCLGVTSAETLINYYLQNEIIEPYIANEIKNRVARHFDLDTSNVFCYFA